MKANLFILLLAPVLFPISFSGCVKDKDPADLRSNDRKTVIFKLDGFRSAIRPFSLANTQHFTQSSQVPNSKNIFSGPVSQFLYFWSFNAQDLVPDIAVDTDGADITYELHSAAAPTFALGYHYNDEYIAGSSFSTTGPEFFTINMPVSGVSKLDSFCFDAVSSNTGPKNFEIYYSTDNGDTETLLPFDCQFTDFIQNKLHRFRFSFGSEIDIAAHDLLTIKIAPIAGNRTGHPHNYNPAAGTVRLDNIRLAGVYNPGETGGGTGPEVPLVSKLHYFIFDSNEGNKLTLSGSSDFNAANASFDLTTELAPGTYSAAFISSVSAEDLLFPEPIHYAEDLYISSIFQDVSATVFGGRKDNIIVEESDVEDTLTLIRLFSKVSFEFTDEAGLPDITRLEVSCDHQPFWYTPYGYTGELPTPEVRGLTFTSPFQYGETGIAFHQFMGIATEPQPVSYTVTVYDTNNQPIRTFTVTSAIKNNVQLTFTGNLQAASGLSGGFSIGWNTHWDDQLTIPF